MIYSTDLANQVTLNNNSSNTKYLEAGIHDNVKFTGVEQQHLLLEKTLWSFVLKKTEKSYYIQSVRNVQKILKNRTRIKQQIRLQELIVS